MESKHSALSSLEIFSPYSPEELALLTASMRQCEFDPGAVIFPEGAAGNSLYIVLSGTVEVTTHISGDVERTLLTLRPGGVFGELSLLTGEARTATAKAKEKTVLMTLNSAGYEQLWTDHPLLCGRLMRYLLKMVARRLGMTTDLYRRAVAWGIEISGVVELNYHELITGQSSLIVELSSGKVQCGVLLKVEKGPVGHELLLKTADGQFVVIPYQAITSISFGGAGKK